MSKDIIIKLILFACFTTILSFSQEISTDKDFSKETVEEKYDEKEITSEEEIKEKEAEEEIYKQLGLKLKKIEKKGFLIEEIVPSSPAERANLKVNDIILAIDNQKFFKFETLNKKLKIENIKVPKAVLILRDDKEILIGWPFLDINLLREEEKNKILNLISQGKENLKNGYFKEGIKNFENALNVSIHYSEREKIYYYIVFGYVMYLNLIYKNLISKLSEILYFYDIQENIYSPKTITVKSPLSSFKLPRITLSKLKELQKDISRDKKLIDLICKDLRTAKYYAGIELVRKNMETSKDFFENIFSEVNFNKKILEISANDFDILYEKLQNKKGVYLKRDLLSYNYDDFVDLYVLTIDLHIEEIFTFINNLIDEMDFAKWLKVKVYSFWDGDPPLKKFCKTFSIPESEIHEKILEKFGKILEENPPPYYTPSCEITLSNYGNYNFEGKIVLSILSPERKIVETKEIPIFIQTGKKEIFTIFMNPIYTENILELKCVFQGIGRIPPKYMFSPKDWVFEIKIINNYLHEENYGIYYINP
ncbi:MAG: PDZ domain-containing protein [Candidatus Omnitrophica bacterium]|nr:PDZ domain-containing protein [Candidatus Omnitrophota bacterium]